MKTLFVVDCQADFLLNDGKLNLGHDTKELRERIGSFMKDFKGHIALTQDTHNAESCEFKSFPEHCLIDTEGWEIVDEVLSVAQTRRPIKSVNDEQKGDDTVEVIFKASFGGLGLFWTLTKDLLEGEIHVVGVATHVCVHDLVSSLVNFSKEKFNIMPDITIHRDMIDDFNPNAAEFALRRLQDLYGAKVV